MTDTVFFQEANKSRSLVLSVTLCLSVKSQSTAWTVPDSFHTSHTPVCFLEDQHILHHSWGCFLSY